MNIKLQAVSDADGRPFSFFMTGGQASDFGRLKDWRRVAARYDRCTIVLFSAVALAATVTFWL